MQLAMFWCGALSFDEFSRRFGLSVGSREIRVVLEGDLVRDFYFHHILVRGRLLHDGEARIENIMHHSSDIDSVLGVVLSLLDLSQDLCCDLCIRRDLLHIIDLD